jgi:hypothetical protein
MTDTIAIGQPLAPLPWTAETVNEHAPHFGLVAPDTIKPLAFFYNAEDAAYARLACNLFPELVEALEAIVERQTGPMKPNTARAIDGEIVRIARDALSKVRSHG